MANCIKLASDELNGLLLDAVGRLVADGKVPAQPIPAFKIEIPADKTHGDFATNLAMASAKAFHMPTRNIASLICESLVLEGSCFERAEIAGPGFINLFLRRKWFSDVVRNVFEEKENYGRTNTGAGKRALVEFVSANPTGPMHVGNARGGALGDSLAEILLW